MKTRFLAIMTVAAFLVLAVSVQAKVKAPADIGSEEFGLTRKQLVQHIQKVEASIAKCMREQGFQYFAVDYLTIRRGMNADKAMPGLGEEEFIERYGFGISTLYTGQHPQVSEGYCPARIGLGRKNVEVFNGLSVADRAAYNRALLGENIDATFAVGLEGEDFSRCGGCTRRAIEEVFEPEQLKDSYYNPLREIIENDPRMKAALRKYGAEMRKAGFDYNHPDDVEADVLKRLETITNGRTITVDKLTPERKKALEELRDYERRVAKLSFNLAEEIFDPVETRIEKEIFAREVK